MSARTLAGPAEKAAVLVEALPYIRRFSDRVVVSAMRRVPPTG